MNKVTNINLGGIIIWIDEEAYQKLSMYIKSVERQFSNVDGKEEIMTDIEGRIAEMLQSKMTSGKASVTMADVDSVISQMGQPEDISEGNENHNQQPSSGTGYTSGDYKSRETYSGKRKLFRDPRHKAIAGVCSGFAAYTGVNVIWFRLAFLGMFFFLGTGFLAYIILAIVIPKATTLTDEMEMRGEPINIDTIKSRVEDEFNGFKGNVGRFKSSPEAQKMSQGVEGFFETIFSSLGSIVKAFFVVISLLFAFFLLRFLFGVIAQSLGWGSTLPVSALFSQSGQGFLFTSALIALISIPIIRIMVWASSYFFKTPRESVRVRQIERYIALSSIIILVICGFIVLRDSSYKSTQRDEKAVVIPGKVLHLALMHKTMEHSSDHSNMETVEDIHFVSWGGLGFLPEYEKAGVKHDLVALEHVSMNIKQSSDSSIHLILVKAVRGGSGRIAEKYLRSISYETEQQGNYLLLSRNLLYPEGDPYRKQHLSLILQIPVGYSIMLDRNMTNFLYDVDNLSDTDDKDMQGHTWTMTRKGLFCKDFSSEVDEEDINTTDSSDGEPINMKGTNITINRNGIRIKGGVKDAEDLVIDSNGIRINGRKPSTRVDSY